MSEILTYGLNCFLLIIPILLGNVIFAKRLPVAFQPEVFGRNIPPFIKYSEITLRIFVLIFPVLMPLNISSPLQKSGLAIFLTGFILYTASWIALIKYPLSAWSRSAAGFLAPAYTPLIWLTGIGLIGDRLFFGIEYHPWIFFAAAFLFVVSHTAHTYIIYKRTKA